ncbi:hypothetical protein [Saccharothrix luteola]|uniref:hypothetical protein n=1 Tax=Saccharothrix luteola TaxID=2893018 RepID=UPI001E4E8FA7|nr:hypothetical protein [Saccharothrix luteola]MCC8244858.1 hypothetical protein [Saccharothrix luteola]
MARSAITVANIDTYVPTPSRSRSSGIGFDGSTRSLDTPPANSSDTSTVPEDPAG